MREKRNLKELQERKRKRKRRRRRRRRRRRKKSAFIIEAEIENINTLLQSSERQ